MLIVPVEPKILHFGSKNQRPAHRTPTMPNPNIMVDDPPMESCNQPPRNEGNQHLIEASGSTRWKEQPAVCSNYFATDEAPPHKPPNPIPIPANKGVTPITEAILYAESSGILLGATPDVRERFSGAGGAIEGEKGGTTTANTQLRPALTDKQYPQNSAESEGSSTPFLAGSMEIGLAINAHGKIEKEGRTSSRKWPRHTLDGHDDKYQHLQGGGDTRVKRGVPTEKQLRYIRRQVKNPSQEEHVSFIQSLSH